MKKALNLPPLVWTPAVASDSKRAHKAAAVVGSETNQSFLASAATRRSGRKNEGALGEVMRIRG
jgi:hypothetical protein